MKGVGSWQTSITYARLKPMKLTFKYRLKPTRAQRRLLGEHLEVCRRVYNRTLAVRQDAYRQRGETLSYYDTSRLLPAWKADDPTLKHVHAQVLQNVQIRVERAFEAFFRRVKAGEKPGYPRFRGAGWYDSFTYPQYGNGVKLAGEWLTLSKIGSVRVTLHRPVVGQIKTVTIQRDPLDNWSACLVCEVAPAPLPPNDRVVGIDLGLKTFATLSDGSTIRRERWLKQDARDIARLQRKKEQSPPGSPEGYHVRRALRHAYRRAAQRRNNFAHQHSRHLVNTYQVLIFEDLDIQGMQAEGRSLINRSIADVAWDQFVRDTRYKAESAGRSVLLVNPRGTTQQCSGCGERVPKDLRVRVHVCPSCGLTLDRDLNAARNILARGLASLPAERDRSRLVDEAE